MANVGELVRMENGRWARFQRCAVFNQGHPGETDLSVVVAVELDEAQQALLNAAADSLELDWQRNASVCAALPLDSEAMH